VVARAARRRLAPRGERCSTEHGTNWNLFHGFNPELFSMTSTLPAARARLARDPATTLLLFSLLLLFGLLLLWSARAGADGEQVSAPPAAAEQALGELLEHADQHSPVMRLARERRAYAAAARAGAEPWLASNPTLGIAVGPRFASGSDTALDVQLSLAQPIEIAGARGSRRAAASRLAQRIDAEVALARSSVRHAVVRAFRSAQVAHESVLLCERALRFTEQVRAVTERRLAAGDATAIDVRLSQAEVAAAQQALLLAQRDSFAARLELAVAAGYPPTSPPPVPAGLASPRPVPSLEGLLAGLRARHPELAVRRAALSEAHARVELADREAWPVPVLGVELTREGPTSGVSNNILLGTLQLPLPLWQRNQGERAQSRAEAAALRAEEHLDGHALEARVARAHAELSHAVARLDVFAASTLTLTESLALIERGFAAGELPLIELLSARQRFLDTEKSRLDAHGEYYRALADLENAAASELAGPTPGGAITTEAGSP
jgi:cobalt-zinc-cadmium efflux system outer membrane protein